MAELQAKEPSETREIRITGHGKIETWVAFALRFLQENSTEPLTLHTLPAKKQQSIPSTEDAVDDTETPVQDAEDGVSKLESEKSRMASSMSTIPRLVSVAEIIKREYLKGLSPELAESGNLSGLHQYNEVGELADEGGVSREDALASMLRGKRHLRQHKVAYMKITLCRQELPHLAAAGAT
ncbi:hypothetical protein OBBRIDRAFT_884432 [Obba rivulosa]|uniref:Uncharacterized protein n=1 Tax=Obba rivulosa TaxID=1052685 RepID=A0A8E2J501_9APHY|nr:hypothetical protein OBBRIDRAFT_884432 [Obba rivulosa]